VRNGKKRRIGERNGRKTGWEMRREAGKEDMKKKGRR